MEDTVLGRPAQSLMLRADNALYEEPIYHKQYDGPDVYEDVCGDSETDVSWGTGPCYSQ